MDNIQKFLSDVNRMRKIERAQNSAAGGEAVCDKAASLFVSLNREVEPLARSFAAYWKEKYIMPSQDISLEPTEEHIRILAAMQSLIENDLPGIEPLSSEDFKELSSLVNFEAENIPIETLNSMMMIFVDKNAL